MKTSLEQQKIFNFIFGLFSIIVIYFLIEIKNKENQTFQFITVYKYDNDSLTINNVKKEILNQKILFPEIVAKQVLLETGNLKCKDCSLNSNNLFGFMYKGKYLKFDYWQQSVQYYKWWQSKKYKDGDYYKFLDGFFAQDSLYIEKLKKIKI